MITEINFRRERQVRYARVDHRLCQVTGKVIMKVYFFQADGFEPAILGLMDKEGFFKIVDRKKDMIKVSGFNVFPNEIENVIARFPKVLEVAAIGVPDAKSGEVIKIFVVKKDPILTEEELKKYCHENLTNYKVPKHIEFRKNYRRPT